MSELVTTAGALTSALKIAVMPIKRRVNSVPILSAVKIDGDKITGTDLDTFMTATVGVERSNLVACIDAAQLRAVVAGLDDDTRVTLQSADKAVYLRFEGGAYSLVSFPVEDFPECKIAHCWDGETHVSGNWGFLEALKGVAFAISTEETRYYLNGACLMTRANGTPCLVATDGHRLALRDLPAAPSSDKEYIIPRQLISLVLKIGMEPQSISLSETAVRMTWPGIELVGLLIDGTYPNVERVIPDRRETRLTIDKSDLRRTLKRVSAMSELRSKAVTLTRDGGHIHVSNNETHTAHAVERIAAEYNGEPGDHLVFCMNARYMIDAIENLPKADQVISFETEDASSSLGVHFDGGLFVLMPIGASNDRAPSIVAMLDQVDEAKAA